MQQALLILLLLTASISGTHETREEENLLTSFVTHNLDEEKGNNFTEVEHNFNDMSRIAIANTLAAFGVNETDFRPGQTICPSTNLSSSYKRRRISVGVAGCILDPLIAHYNKEQREALKEEQLQYHSTLNCTDPIYVPGYFPPVSGMHASCNHPTVGAHAIDNCMRLISIIECRIALTKV